VRHLLASFQILFPPFSISASNGIQNKNNFERGKMEEDDETAEEEGWGGLAL
jgi:hypothetical protein